MVMLVRWLNGDIAAAEDVTQETFITAWIKRDSVPDPSRGWLFGVARNHLRNHWRFTRRHPSVEYDHETMGHLNAASPADASLGAIDLELSGRLLSLNDTDREVLQLRYIDDLDCNEIAQALGIRPAAARKRLSRAEKNAAALLADKFTQLMGDSDDESQ